jgi:hypothetical protein
MIEESNTEDHEATFRGRGIENAMDSSLKINFHELLQTMKKIFEDHNDESGKPECF